MDGDEDFERVSWEDRTLASPEADDTKGMFPQGPPQDPFPSASEVGSGLRRRPEPDADSFGERGATVEWELELDSEDVTFRSPRANPAPAPSSRPPPVPAQARRSGPPPVPPRARGARPGTIPPPPGPGSWSPRVPAQQPAQTNAAGRAARPVRFADEDAPELGELLARGGRRVSRSTGEDEFDRVLGRYRQLDDRPPIPAMDLFRSLPPPSPPSERSERVVRGLKAAGLVLLLGLPVVAAIHVLTHLDEMERFIETPAAFDDPEGGAGDVTRTLR